jgi:hypothetical protein
MANSDDTNEPITRLNGFAIGLGKDAMNGSTKEEFATTTPLLNGHPITNGDKQPILEHRVTILGPLREVTNTDTPTHPATSDGPTNEIAPSLAPNALFKIPPLPSRKASPVPDDTLPHTKTSVPHESTPNPKLRRWSSTPTHPHNATRRNSFPSARKDALEELQHLKEETKPAKEKTAAISITNATLLTRRKNSIPGPLTGSILSTGGGVGGGSFGMKPDSRSRSTTTPGILPTPGVIPQRRGSFFADNRPLLTPRLEILRRDSARLDALPSTLWDYLMIEMENFEPLGVEDYKKERLSNFLRIPQTFEKVRILEAGG